MRKINTRHFRVATRSTPREINRQIVLNLIREHQPISRAELARRMQVGRSALTALVRELVAGGSVYEDGLAASRNGPGRRGTLLRLRSNTQLALAMDVRPSRTAVVLADFSGRTMARDVFETPATPEALIEELVGRSSRLLRVHAAEGGSDGACVGAGLVVPGMVDRRTGRVIYSPRLRWRDVELRETLERRLSLPVTVESAPIACALARLWLSPEETRGVHSFAYVSISDGVGVGLVVNGEILRGNAHTAGEFGHVSMDPHGPPCACGKRGCWEALVCNSTTVARYAERALGPADARPSGAAPRTTIEDVVRRAARGERAAVLALTETGQHIGRGLSAVVSAFNPGRIYMGGEITAAWELLVGPIRHALAEGTLTEVASATPVVPDSRPAEYRQLGAVALVAAPTFAAPNVG